MCTQHVVFGLGTPAGCEPATHSAQAGADSSLHGGKGEINGETNGERAKEKRLKGREKKRGKVTRAPSKSALNCRCNG